MKTVKTFFAPAAPREREAEQINAHALGVTLATATGADMRRFEVIEKERLVEQHAAEIGALTAEIHNWQARVTGLEAQLRIQARRENKLMLGLGALAMVVAYFYLRDYGCSAPLWTRMGW